MNGISIYYVNYDNGDYNCDNEECTYDTTNNYACDYGDDDDSGNATTKMTDVMRLHLHPFLSHHNSRDPISHKALLMVNELPEGRLMLAHLAAGAIGLQGLGNQ